MKRVYFMRPIGMAGPIKIGCSVTPESRLKSLDIWSPFPLELLASAPGDNRDENRLHWRFGNDRTHGEWFQVSIDLLNLIDHVRLNGSLPPLEAVPRNHSSRRLRNHKWRNVKAVLGRRLNTAETWAWGHSGRRGMRPARIQALRDKCEGAHQPPLTGPDLEEVEAYIAHLRSLPDGRNGELQRKAVAKWEALWAARRAAQAA